MYTRRHYNDMASFLQGLEGVTPKQRTQIARQLASRFEKDNPSFDRDKFYIASGLIVPLRELVEVQLDE